MVNVRKIKDDLFYIGCSDRRLALFESAYKIPKGVSYNSYLLKDEKTVLFDTVDKACTEQFLDNLSVALEERKLDYLIVQHMEPDHAALIGMIMKEHTETQIVCSMKAKDMILQFFPSNIEERIVTKKEGDILNTGNHELMFVAAPMVHWPEVMVTFDKTTGTLFSADGFGSFGAINGALFDTNIDFDHDYVDEARRYYTNIVGKYGQQVQMLLKKASGLDIKMICPLHGLIITKNIGKFVEKYDKWSSYTPEINGVVIAYSSVYGHTEEVMDLLATKLVERGIKDIAFHDVSYTEHSKVLADVFKYSHLVLASTTYNMGIFESMEAFINIMKAHNVQNRKVALFANGTWMPHCANLMKSEIESLKNVEFIEPEVFVVKSKLKNEQIVQLDNLADAIVKSLGL